MSCTSREKPNYGSSLLRITSAAWLISRAWANCPLGGNWSYSSMNSHNCPVCERGDTRQPCRSRTGWIQMWPFVKAPSLGAGQCLWHRGLYSKHLWLGIPYHLCRDLADFWTFSTFYSRCFSLSCCCLKGPQNLMLILASERSWIFQMSGSPKLLPGCRIMVFLGLGL